MTQKEKEVLLEAQKYLKMYQDETDKKHIKEYTSSVINEIKELIDKA